MLAYSVCFILLERFSLTIFPTSLFASFAVFLAVFPASFGDLSFDLSGSFASFSKCLSRSTQPRATVAVVIYKGGGAL